MGIQLAELNAWLTAQVDSWEAWAVGLAAPWVILPTGNERFPTLGAMFRHAFTPLHRYSDQSASSMPVDDSHIDPTDWPALLAWARLCLARHREVCASIGPGVAEEMVDFQTRSSGTLHVRRRLALAHAATHCFWHLGGIAHLLRHAGIAPPPRSDLIMWAATQADSQA